jgi:hypothetical protein
MKHGAWFTRLRQFRFAIGLIAATALLFGAFLPAFASVGDPLQAYLAEHLCGPGSTSNSDTAPANPSEHQQKCQLCGPSCAMGGHAPVATLSDGVISVARFSTAIDTPDRPDTAARAPLSLYPSDAFSQGPPQAV